MSVQLRGVVRAGVPVQVRNHVLGDGSTRPPATTLTGRRPLIAAGVLLLVAVIGAFTGPVGVAGSVAATGCLIAGLAGFAVMRGSKGAWARGEVPWAWRAAAITATGLEDALAADTRAAQTLATYQRIIDDLRHQTAVRRGWISGLNGDTLDDMDWAATVKILAGADIQVLPPPGVRDRIGALGGARQVIWTTGDDSDPDVGIFTLLPLAELAGQISIYLAQISAAQGGTPFTGRPYSTTIVAVGDDGMLPPISIPALVAEATAANTALAAYLAELADGDAYR